MKEKTMKEKTVKRTLLSVLTVVAVLVLANVADAAVINFTGDGTEGVRGDDNWTCGNLIEIGDADITINALGVHDHQENGFFAAAVEVGLWSADGSTLIASAFAAGSGTLSNSYRYALLDGDVVLAANTQYLIGARVGGGIEWIVDTHGTTPVFSAGSGITIVADRFINTSSDLTAPTFDGGGDDARWAPANAIYLPPTALITYSGDGTEPVRGEADWTVGSLIQIGAADITINALGAHDVNEDGFFTNSVEVGLWTADGSTLIASAFAAGDGTLINSYRYALLGSDVVLAANTQYLIGARTGAGIEWIVDTQGTNAVFGAGTGVAIVADRFINTSSALTAPTYDGGGDDARWAPANAIYIGDPGPDPDPATPALLSVGSNGSNVLVGAINMAAGAIYTLQGTESLTVTNWVDLSTTTGVSSVEWTVPATNDVQFFRVSGE